MCLSWFQSTGWKLATLLWLHLRGQRQSLPLWCSHSLCVGGASSGIAPSRLLTHNWLSTDPYNTVVPKRRSIWSFILVRTRTYAKVLKSMTAVVTKDWWESSRKTKKRGRNGPWKGVKEAETVESLRWLDDHLSGETMRGTTGDKGIPVSTNKIMKAWTSWNYQRNSGISKWPELRTYGYKGEGTER